MTRGGPFRQRGGRARGRGRGGGRGRGEGARNERSGGGYGGWKRKRDAGAVGFSSPGMSKRSKQDTPRPDRLPSGDMLDDANDNGDMLQTENMDKTGTEVDSSGINQAASSRQSKSEFRVKHRERLLAVKDKRRLNYEKDRQVADLRMRNDPAGFLWEQYAKWAGEKLSPLERDSEQWTSEEVSAILDRKDDEDGSVISAVKELTKDPYSRKSLISDGIPGVSVHLVASSGLRAANLSKAMYDGKPVGKFFSKHIKKSEQQEWLKKFASSAASPTAVGTARRLQLLCEERLMTLATCTTFVIDMKRDAKLFNILDISATRDELFNFMHEHMRPMIRAGQVKVFLLLPKPALEA